MAQKSEKAEKTGAFVLTLAVPVGIFVVGLLAYWIAWAKNKLRAQSYLWVGFLVAELVFYIFWVLMWFGVPPPPWSLARAIILASL